MHHHQTTCKTRITMKIVTRIQDCSSRAAKNKVQEDLYGKDQETTSALSLMDCSSFTVHHQNLAAPPNFLSRFSSVSSCKWSLSKKNKKQTYPPTVQIWAWKLPPINSPHMKQKERKNQRELVFHRWLLLQNIPQSNNCELSLSSSFPAHKWALPLRMYYAT